MRNGETFEEWFYKQNGQACGPVSPEKLKELIAGGQIESRQPVWRRVGDNLMFVRAAAVLQLGETPLQQVSHG